MKKILYLFLMGALTTNAQITVNNTDMPQLNDTVRFSVGTAVDVTTRLSQTGANQTWDFSDLTAASQDIASFKSASSINFAYVLSFATSTYGTEAPNANFGTVQANNVYQFYKNTSNSFACDGRGFEISGSPLPLSQTFTGKDIVYKFPLAFGNTDSNSYVSSEVNAVIGTMSGVGKRVNEVDAWGSITTPLGTFNCLRIKSTVTTTDTIKSTLIPFPIPFTQTFTEYKWIAKGHKIPILEIRVNSGTGGQTTIRYKDRYRAEAYTNKARFTIRGNKTLYAVNSTDTCVLTSTSLNGPKSVLWTITPGTFTYTGGTNNTSNAVKLFFTDTGKYTVKLTAVYDGGSDDTTRVDVISVAEGPHAKFVSDKQHTNTSTSVNFYDSSEGSPTAWLWTFTPNTVTFTGGTSASSQNPKVIFDMAGTYDVSLKVTNAIGTNTLNKSAYIVNLNTGVKDVATKTAGWLLLPNPVVDQLLLKATDTKIKHILILDLTGKSINLPYTVMQNGDYQVDCTSLRPGIYFIKVTNADGETSSKRFSVK